MINFYVLVKYVFVKVVKPFYPEYNDSVHVAQDIIDYNDSLTLWIGLDFGLTPAALFAQRDPRDGQWQILDELVTEDMGAERFAEELGRMLRQPEYRSSTEVQIWGDPAGDTRAETDERTPYDILSANGINASPAKTPGNPNDFILRREAVAHNLTRMTHMGRPRLIISPKAKNFRKAMAGRYCYRRLKVSGDERYVDKPDKGPYSHIAEAGQYLMIGAGEDAAVLGGGTPSLDRKVITQIDHRSRKRPKQIPRIRKRHAANR